MSNGYSLTKRLSEDFADSVIMFLDSIDTTFELEYRSICEVLEKISCFQ